MSRRPTAAVVVPVTLVVGTAVLYLVGLGHPDDIVFDETYYVEDARSMLDTGVEEGFAVHPPLGKWLIAAGMVAVGDNPVGWRVATVLAGILAVALTYLLVRALTGRPAVAGAAGLLLAADGVFLVQARTAMLDAFLPPFILLGAYLLVRDHQRWDVEEVRWRPFVAGLALGLAVAVKWSALLALGGAGLVLLGWEVVRRRRTGASRSRALVAAAGFSIAALLVVPAVAYAISWAPWLVNYDTSWAAERYCPTAEGDRPQEVSSDCPEGIGERLSGLWRFHGDILRFHLDLEAEHPYRSPATTWPLQTRPVVYHWESCPAGATEDADPDAEPCLVPEGHAQEIVALGNLGLWWAAVPFLPILAAGAARRDRRSGMLLVFLGAQYLPWLVVARPVFSFYAVPLVPFLAAGVAVAASRLDLSSRQVGAWVFGVAGGVVGGLGGWAAASALDASLFGGLVLGGGIGLLLGGGLGGVLDQRADLRLGPPIRRRRIGSLLLAVIVVLAAAFFVWFAPLWYGVTLPSDVIRQRWWLNSWI